MRGLMDAPNDSNGRRRHFHNNPSPSPLPPPPNPCQWKNGETSKTDKEYIKNTMYCKDPCTFTSHTKYEGRLTCKSIDEISELIDEQVYCADDN
jgi:hypothetical protein